MAIVVTVQAVSDSLRVGAAEIAVRTVFGHVICQQKVLFGAFRRLIDNDLHLLNTLGAL